MLSVYCRDPDGNLVEIAYLPAAVMDAASRVRIGLGGLRLLSGVIPLANWMIGHVGTVCVPTGPCLVPVAPGLLAPSGVLTVGAALVLRDVVQRCLGPDLGIAGDRDRHTAVSAGRTGRVGGCLGHARSR